MDLLPAIFGTCEDVSGVPKYNRVVCLYGRIDVKCEDCQHEFTIDEPIFMCPKCDSFNTELISGKELYIETMEGMKE